VQGRGTLSEYRCLCNPGSERAGVHCTLSGLFFARSASFVSIADRVFGRRAPNPVVPPPYTLRVRLTAAGFQVTRVFIGEKHERLHNAILSRIGDA
jgi:hypothetical protein